MMISRNFFKNFFLTGMVCVALGTVPVFAAQTPDTNKVADAESKAAEDALVGRQDLARSNLQIQEQLHSALMAIERNRQEAETASVQNAKMIDDRLGKMENKLEKLDDQKLAEWQSIQNSDRLVMIAAGIFATVGFLVLGAAAFLQWTAVNRLAGLAARMAAPAPVPALGMGEGDLMPSKLLEQSTARFLAAVERLEQRIHAMEASTGKNAAQLAEANAENGGVSASVASAELPITTTTTASVPAEEGAHSPAAKAGEVSTLLSKGQTLLKLDQPTEALDCFNQVLALDPGHAEALVKKGAALERLQRLDEAIECYDRAIERDNSMTMAYLYKGGVFNRMERYSEALKCYEQALKSQQLGHAANVIID